MPPKCEFCGSFLHDGAICPNNTPLPAVPSFQGTDEEALQTVFDVAVNSLDFGSGFLDLREVCALRRIAELLGVDPIKATPGSDRSKFYRIGDTRNRKGPEVPKSGNP